MRDLAALTADDFEPLTGSDFRVAASKAAGSTAETSALVIRLVEVRRLKERPGYRPPFVLHFEGPLSPVLAQEVHHLSHPELGELELFVGPVMFD
ncbi:MAG TPA: hypothetical protein VEJ84_09130, partial [Acidimicrobiales bacterium]|nr:hypothetical protein [Acidimicrobiales bacterium]